MFSFKGLVCVTLTFCSVGCQRNDEHPRPDTNTNKDTNTTTPQSTGTTTTGSAAPSHGAALGSNVGDATGSGSAASGTGTGGTTAGKGSDNEVLNDQQIAAITEAANEGEIAQAKVAQTKARNARVKAFAAKMIAHHGQAKEKQSKLELTTADSQLSKQLKDEAATTLASLNSAAAGAGFDQTYMSAQVTGHQKVLDTINDRLLPNVKNDRLAAYVKDIKPTVESHLKEARDINESLGSDKQAGATGGAGNSTRAGASTTGTGTGTGTGTHAGTGTGTHAGTGTGTGSGTRLGTGPATP